MEFDNAVSVAFDFAEKHPGEVLIMVTGDHETGMLIVGHSSTGSRIFLPLLANQKASRGILIRETERFVRDGGENATFEHYKSFITEKTGLIFTEEGRWQAGNLNLTQNEMRELENDFNRTKAAIDENASSGRDRVVRTMIRMLNNKAGLTWGSGGHTGMPVITATWGNQAEPIVRAIRDNTDIAKQLKQAVGTLSP
jgi:alkaline phosphatase